MARSSQMSHSATSRDIAEIGRLLRDLEGQLSHLAKSVATDARDASSNIPDMISEVLSGLSERFRTGVQSSARNVGQEAARVGTDAWHEAARVGTGAWHRIEGEVVSKPLAALAIAAGIGFLIGALNRR
jgi:ElaB/YqjD/DUF883 family membrane-anchored ribosome-binding protein